jgi:hypothetical protein
MRAEEIRRTHQEYGLCFTDHELDLGESVHHDALPGPLRYARDQCRQFIYREYRDGAFGITYGHAFCSPPLLFSCVASGAIRFRSLLINKVSLVALRFQSIIVCLVCGSIAVMSILGGDDPIIQSYWTAAFLTTEQIFSALYVMIFIWRVATINNVRRQAISMILSSRYYSVCLQ